MIQRLSEDWIEDVKDKASESVEAGKEAYEKKAELIELALKEYGCYLNH